MTQLIHRTSTDLALERRAERLASVFRTLGDPNRVRMLMHLGSGEKDVTSVCEHLQLAQPTVSHHLGVLRMAGLVCSRRQGKHVFYSLCPNALAGLPADLRDLFPGDEDVAVEVDCPAALSGSS